MGFRTLTKRITFNYKVMQDFKRTDEYIRLIYELFFEIVKQRSIWDCNFEGGELIHFKWRVNTVTYGIALTPVKDKQWDLVFSMTGKFGTDSSIYATANDILRRDIVGDNQLSCLLFKTPFELT